MRILIIAMGLATLAASPAMAQVSRASSGTAAAASTTTTGTATTTTGTTSLPSTAVGAEPVLTAPANSSTATTGTTTTGTGTSTTTAGAGTGFGTNQQTNPAAATNPINSFGPGGSFSNDSGNSALGTSPGQTSSGTFAGNSGEGLGAGSATLNPGTVGVIGTPTVVPEGNVSVIGGGTTGGGMGGIPSQQSQQVTIAPAARTPLFDQVAREGREKEARRRARGEEPRVYGIAPNTERDLTWQMPDDRIIRY